MRKILALFVATVALSSCTDSEGAHKALEAQGFKRIEITGYNFFGCSKEDMVHTGFTAVGVNGH